MPYGGNDDDDGDGNDDGDDDDDDDVMQLDGGVWPLACCEVVLGLGSEYMRECPGMNKPWTWRSLLFLGQAAFS